MLRVRLLRLVRLDRQIEERFYIGVIDAENWPRVADLRLESEFHRPLHGADDLRPAKRSFPWLEVRRLLLANLHQRIAREAVERLVPSFLDHGNAAEGMRLHVLFLRQPKRAEDPKKEYDEER